MAKNIDKYGVEFSPDGRELIKCPKKLEGGYVIPDGVETIAIGAFMFCEELTKIVIPHSVTNILEDALFGCSGLTSLEIPDSVTHIGNRAFAWCADVESIAIPSRIKTISAWAFADCFKLNNVTIGKGVTSIGEGAFEQCYGLVDIEIPSNVTSIGEGAFGDCDHLTSVALRHGVSQIEANAFSHCYKLTNILIPNSVTYIAASAFRGCDLKAIDLEKGNSKYSTHRGVLFSKDRSTLIAYPNGKNKKGKYTIPDFVTRIGEDAFKGCQLHRIVIGDNVAQIDSALGGWRLKEIIVSTNNPKYCSLDGILYNQEKTALISYPSKKCQNGKYIIPDFVSHIGDNAFSGSSLRKVVLGNTLNSIGHCAFANCSSLVEVSIPEGITSIGDYAFYDCDNLLSVKISDNVKYIGEAAFDCCQLSNVIIGSNVKKIGGGNFRSPDLMSIVCKAATPPKCGKEVFRHVNKSECKLFVPSESVELYKSARIWRSFKNILPM